MPRTLDTDVLECHACCGRLRITSAVIELDAAEAILERLGIPTEAARATRARDPTTLYGDDQIP